MGVNNHICILFSFASNLSKRLKFCTFLYKYTKRTKFSQENWQWISNIITSVYAIQSNFIFKLNSGLVTVYVCVCLNIILILISIPLTLSEKEIIHLIWKTNFSAYLSLMLWKWFILRLCLFSRFDFVI